MPVDMYDADVTVYVRCNPPNIWIAKTVIAAAEYRKSPRGIDMGYSFANLVEGFFDIARDHKNVSRITKIKLFGQVNAPIDGITIVDC
jgi:hypothetical protein